MPPATLEHDRLSETFAALANPTRRAILVRLADGAATVNQLAEPFARKLAVVSKHIKVPDGAGLVAAGQPAQCRPCALDPAPLAEVSAWTDQYRAIWEGRFDRMDEYLDDLRGQSKGQQR